MKRALVTAGATRNKIDAIRYLSANATGTTGCRLAERLWENDWNVDLLGSAEAILRQRTPLPSHEFTTTRDLEDRMKRLVPLMDLVIHSAAVGDYELAEPLDAKIPSSCQELVLRLTPAPKILDQIRGWNPNCRLVSFKAATPGTDDDTLVAIATAQRVRTGSNLVFANVIGAQDSGIHLVTENGTTRFTSRPAALEALMHWVEWGKLPR